MKSPFALMAIARVVFGMPYFADAGSGDKSRDKADGGEELTKGLGRTDRPGAGGGMGEDTTPKGSVEGPRSSPPGQAPGYEQADKGKRTAPTMGGQSDFSPPAGLPEDPIPRAGTGR
jgi:hypothetical protein